MRKRTGRGWGGGLTTVVAVLLILPLVVKIIATQQMSAYAGDRYGVRLENQVVFDSGPMAYGTDITVDGNDYRLTCFLRRGTIRDERLDEELSARLAALAGEIENELPREAVFHTMPRTEAEVKTKDYADRRQMLYWTDLYCEEALTEEESAQMPGLILAALLAKAGEEFAFYGVQCTYFDANGGFVVAIPADSDQPLTAERIAANTRKMVESEWPEEYRAFLESR